MLRAAAATDFRFGCVLHRIVEDTAAATCAIVIFLPDTSVLIDMRFSCYVTLRLLWRA